MPPQQQAALVMLAWARGCTVSADELVDGIWGDDRPRSAVGALRNHAYALRKCLAVRPGTVVLCSESGGYQLKGSLELDVDRVERHRAELAGGRAAHLREQADIALRAMLREWRGEPLSGVPGPWAAAERARLRRMRQAVWEDLVDLALERGEYLRAIADLQPLISGDPHSERLRGLMMTALYRAGRRAEALEEYQRVRRLLVSEQGIEPGPALLKLHQRILADDLPDLPVVAATVTAVAPAPAQLPPDTADFTGREELAEGLCAWLADTATAIVSISGMGGVGKTALALHVAHRLRGRYPDGQLYADLHGGGAEPAEPEHVLGAFLRGLGVREKDIPVSVAERAALFRSAISGRRMLLVLDDASGTAQVLPLLPGEPGCAVLVTARRPLTALPGVHPAALQVFEPEEAVALFTRIVGAQRVAAEPDATRDIVELCGLLPIAVRIMAARVAARPQWTIRSEADFLSTSRQDLDRFRTGDLTLTKAFRAGYEQLPPATARAFRLLAMTDLPDMPIAATAAVLDTTERQAEDLCEELVDRGMLETVGRGRYHYHDLMRLFALGCRGDDADVDVTMRLLDYYLATMKTVLRVRHPGLRLGLAPTSHPGAQLADLDATRDFLDIERRNLVTLYRLAAAGRPHHRALATDLALLVAETTLAGDATVDIEKALEELIGGAEADGDALGACRARLALVFAQVAEFGEPQRASGHVQRLLEEVDPIADPWIAASAHGMAGTLALHDRDPALALTHFSTALALHRRGGSPECVRMAYAWLAQANSAAGRHRDALAAAARAVVAGSHSGTRRNIVFALTEAAWVMSRQGEGELSTRLFDAALSTARRAGNTRFESLVHARAAMAHLTAGRLAQAAEQAQLAEATRDSARTGAVAHTYNMLIRYTALQRLGRTVEADECYHAAASRILDFDATLSNWNQLMAARE